MLEDRTLQKDADHELHRLNYEVSLFQIVSQLESSAQDNRCPPLYDFVGQ
jgi:hypothetical protein